MLLKRKGKLSKPWILFDDRTKMNEWMETEAVKIVKKGLFTESERFSCRHWAYYRYKSIEETFQKTKLWRVYELFPDRLGDFKSSNHNMHIEVLSFAHYNFSKSGGGLRYILHHKLLLHLQVKESGELTSAVWSCNFFASTTTGLTLKDTHGTIPSEAAS